MEYNGFKNKATWLVSLWLNNEEHIYTYWRNVAHTIGRQYPPMNEAVGRLADRLEDCFQGMAVDALETNPTNPMFIDILQSALADVDWETIAEHFIDAAARV